MVGDRHNTADDTSGHRSDAVYSEWLAPAAAQKQESPSRLPPETNPSQPANTIFGRSRAVDAKRAVYADRVERPAGRKKGSDVLAVARPAHSAAKCKNLQPAVENTP